jgi:membrane associated rhomboid family serine protease
MARAPAFNLPAAVVGLSAVLVSIHVLRQFISEEADEWVLLAFAFIPERYAAIGAMLPGGAAARVWSPLTYSLLHADTMHLIVNLLWMASFGAALARRLGTTRFLLLGFVAAVAGAGLHYVVHADDVALMIGASGAVSGMMAATARFAFAPGGPLAGGGGQTSYCIAAESLLRVLTRSRALGFILVWFAINLLFGFADGLVPGASGPIAWEAHIGGFLAGLLLFPLFDPVRRHSTPG